LFFYTPSNEINYGTQVDEIKTADLAHFPMAQKFDIGKPRWDLLPMTEVEDIVEVFTFGAKKYGDRNWEKGIETDRLFAACMRHLAIVRAGERIDDESGLPHLAHAAANLLMWMNLDKKQF